MSLPVPCMICKRFSLSGLCLSVLRAHSWKASNYEKLFSSKKIVKKMFHGLLKTQSPAISQAPRPGAALWNKIFIQ